MKAGATGAGSVLAAAGSERRGASAPIPDARTAAAAAMAATPSAAPRRGISP